MAAVRRSDRAPPVKRPHHGHGVQLRQRHVEGSRDDRGVALYTCENIRLNIALRFTSVYFHEYFAERRRYTPECRRGGSLEGEADESVEEAHGLWEYVLFRL
jgi:hypothetical protein